jgi:hypothetical protein
MAFSFGVEILNIKMRKTFERNGNGNGNGTEKS